MLLKSGKGRKEQRNMQQANQQRNPSLFLAEEENMARRMAADGDCGPRLGNRDSRDCDDDDDDDSLSVHIYEWVFNNSSRLAVERASAPLSSNISIMHAKGLWLPLSGKE